MQTILKRRTSLAIILLATVLSILTTTSFVHVSAGTFPAERPGTGKILFILLLWAMSTAIPFAAALIAILLSFRGPRHPRTRLAIILLGYLSVIVSFSGLYYSLSTIGDYKDAQEQYNYYWNQRKHLEAGRIQVVLRRQHDDRAFKGINERLWHGIGQHFPAFVDREAVDLPVEHILENAAYADLAWGQKQTIKFQPENRLAVWMACFHFSVDTIATVGYGDVAANQWYSRLASDLEVIFGIALLVVGLGLCISEFQSPYCRGSEN
jgi:hypothetical protein